MFGLVCWWDDGLVGGGLVGWWIGGLVGLVGSFLCVCGLWICLCVCVGVWVEGRVC